MSFLVKREKIQTERTSQWRFFSMFLLNTSVLDDKNESSTRNEARSHAREKDKLIGAVVTNLFAPVTGPRCGPIDE